NPCLHVSSRRIARFELRADVDLRGFVKSARGMIGPPGFAPASPDSLPFVPPVHEHPNAPAAVGAAWIGAGPTSIRRFGGRRTGPYHTDRPRTSGGSSHAASPAWRQCDRAP